MTALREPNEDLRSFDGISIAFRDEGTGLAVILLHGFAVDGPGQFGAFDEILPVLEKRKPDEERSASCATSVP